MNHARQEILDRIGVALSDVSDEDAQDIEVDYEYRRRPSRPLDAVSLTELFAERVRDYGAGVVHCRADEVAESVDAACRKRALRQLLYPPGLPAQWLPRDVEIVPDSGQTVTELERIGAALTGCAAAISETGTLLLDGGARCGRRAVTLVPDHHICVVQTEQIVAAVPEALNSVVPAAIGERRPVTLISGPSASSDIELTRVEGVHGPRDLLVIIAEG